MAEEVKETEQKTPLLDAFMKAGKISVFESGLDRPDHLQDRPFFNLLPQGETTFINMSETADKLIKVVSPCGSKLKNGRSCK